MRKRHRLRITGLVQGVFYRDTAKQVADEMGVAGWIRNEPDGSVYAEAEAEEVAMQRFIDWCRRGPPAASVKNVEVGELPLEEGIGFMVRR